MDKKSSFNLFFSVFIGLGTSLPVGAQVIYQNKAYQWKGNEIIQGEFKAKAKSAFEIQSNYKKLMPSKLMGDMIDPPSFNRKQWTAKSDLSQLPGYVSDNKLENAIYNMSLEESLLAIEPDSTFRTGVFWGGVWTRDVSYSIIHSLAQIQPEVSKISLLAKVNANNRIIQDTGTGGAWPCSTDRMIWVLAAWEVYKVTGEKEWLDRIYPIIRNTVDDDQATVVDPKTGLLHGETSFLDWREQEYPAWMQPVDIYQSESLGTNAVHYMAVHVLAQICRLQGQPADAKRYDAYARQIADGINKYLWIPEKGYYGIYLYGRNHPMLNEQSETLGEALTVLFDIADKERAKSITQNVVNEDFGTPCIYPNLSDQPPYHNDGVWPFVQGYWMKANAKVGNEEGLLHSIASIYRTAALHLTNQENFVVYNGDYGGTQINSPRQLWSVAADLSIVHNIYFGINYELDGIRFAPFVPKALKGKRHLNNFHYRNAILDITISGYGNQIKSFILDGKETAEPRFPGNLDGTHTISIILSNNSPEKQKVTYAENCYLPLTPVSQLKDNVMTWNAVKGAKTYQVIRNGRCLKTVNADVLRYTLSQEGEYQITAVDEKGNVSFASEPVDYYKGVKTYEVEDFALPYNANRRVIKESEGVGSGLSSNLQARAEMPKLTNVSFDGAKGHFAQITRNENILITIPFHVDADGLYALKWRYANGNGPINTENKCASRLLRMDGKSLGVSVFPQRGKDQWNDWGFSNVITCNLSKGEHTLTLEFNEHTENMNLTINQAMIDQLCITKLTE